MKNYLIPFYAAALIATGLIALLKSHSLPSFISSALSGGALLALHYFGNKGSRTVQWGTTALLIALLSIFTYRFVITQQIWPAGTLLVITLLTLATFSVCRSDDQHGKDKSE